MAEQETRERDDAGSTDATSETTTGTEGSESTEDGGTSQGERGAESSKGESSKDDSSEGGSSKGGSSEGGSSKDESSKDDSSEGGSSPAQRSENHAKPQEPTDSDREAQEANRRSFLGRRSSDDEDDAPTGERRRSSVDVGELVWKIANVAATVIRVVTLVFAVVLVADIALVVVGVNPANGVASFLRGFADTVVLGFRDLFLPADPTIALVVNYGVAAVFWVVVGGFVSAGIRFLAARIN